MLNGSMPHKSGKVRHRGFKSRPVHFFNNQSDTESHMFAEGFALLLGFIGGSGVIAVMLAATIIEYRIQTAGALPVPRGSGDPSGEFNGEGT